MASPGISVVCNTFNSELYLDLVLKSVQPLADEIIVCDMHSTDKTQEIAQQSGAKLILTDPIGYVEPARKAAVDQAQNDWILIIDSDEILEPSLVPILKEIAAKNQENTIWIPSRNFMFGGIAEGAGFAADQDKHIRFFRKDAVDLKPEIHAGIIARPEAIHLKLDSKTHGALTHFNYISIEDFITKLNKYTSIEVNARKEVSPKKKARILRRMFTEFRHRYLRRGGKQAGWRGFALSLLMVCYDIVTELKVIERAEGHNRQKTIQDYRAYAENILKN